MKFGCIFLLSLAASLTALADDAERTIQGLEQRVLQLKAVDSDLRADVEIFYKGHLWATRYDEPLSAKDRELLKWSLDRGFERADAIQRQQATWITKKGAVARGYVSAIDGSTQPYGVIIPQSYDGQTPIRLDVVLHGSSKPVGMSELRFISRFDSADTTDSRGPDVDYIELHPLGRVENCYRWGGETDVFEAIEAVCRNYRIDRDRIVLRGMSMGASGTWHLGLKHPDRFVALGPYCGYVDTHRFSETPVPNFIKVGPLPWYQELGLHMLDSVDYAANAHVVPVVAAIGDQDVFFQAHVIMEAAFAREGLSLVNLVSHGTGHVIDPATQQEQLRRIGEYASRGLERRPSQLTFETWTLKYHQCHWIQLLGLKQHYSRADIEARIDQNGVIEIANLNNVTRFAIDPRRLPTRQSQLRIEGTEIDLPHSDDLLTITFHNDRWQRAETGRAKTAGGKRPGLQGPIDDAFCAPFLCVRGTGTPRNTRIHEWAEARLRRFEYEWARYLRGDLPVKDDTLVTQDDLNQKHLILFGDPGSNLWIAKALGELPITWNENTVAVGDYRYSSLDHAPAGIFDSPLAPNRYLVLNCGHTFHEPEFAAFNYLLFPRLGDWGIIQVQPGAREWNPSSANFPEQVIQAGFFDETWTKPITER